MTSTCSSWIFGYGSLIWRPGFSYRHTAMARIHGWVRRFWQGSPDHRGVPGAPGRVVTLVEAMDETCWGRAFEIDPLEKPAILAALDHREQGGYQRLALPLRLEDGRTVQGLTWLATPDNPEYLGPASLEAMTAQVLQSTGPSGPNSEYVLRLDDALRTAGHGDSHVQALADRVRAGLAQLQPSA